MCNLPITYCKQHAMRVISFIACIIIINVACALAHADNRYPPDMLRILQRGKLIVATYSKEIPPFIYNNENGTLGGIDIEIANDIGQKLGVPVEFVRVTDNFNELPKPIIDRQADVIISAFSKTLKRATQVFFTDDYVSLHKTLMLNRLATSGLIDQKGSINGLNNPAVTIGANEGSVYADFLRELLPEATIRLYKSHRTAAPDIMSGAIAGFLCDETCADHYNKQRSWNKVLPPVGWGITVRTITLEKGQDLIAMATHYNDTALHSWLNAYIAQAKMDGSLAKILAKYLN